MTTPVSNTPTAPPGYVLISTEQIYVQLQGIAADVAAIKTNVSALASLGERVSALENRIAGYMVPLAAGGGVIGALTTLWQSLH